MIHRLLLSLALLLSLGLTCSEVVHADSIDPTYSFSYAGADGVTDTATTTSASWDLSTSADLDGASADSDTTVLSTSINFGSDLVTAATLYSYVDTDGLVEFDVSGDWNYELSGSVGFGGGDASAYMILFLMDLTTDTMVFHEDSALSVSGQTGSLVSGHEYEFYFHSGLFAESATSFTGAGAALITFSQPVPEPSSIALLGLGLVGVFVARRRRARAAV